MLLNGDGDGDGDDHIDNDNKIGNNEEAEDAENWANSFVESRLWQRLWQAKGGYGGDRGAFGDGEDDKTLTLEGK